jgi:hypothetical protein
MSFVLVGIFEGCVVVVVDVDVVVVIVVGVVRVVV